MIPPDFAISVAAIGSDIRLTVDGELDIVTAGELADAVGAAAGHAGDVVVDLAGVTFIDSTAIHALIDAQHLLTARGQRLRLATPTRIVTRVLDLSGLARNFTIDTARPGSIAASAPAGEPGLEAILHALARHLLTERSLRDDLERILGLAGDSIPPCAAGSIALLVDGQPITVAVNEQLAWVLDLAQYESREGPCLEALHGEPIRVDDLDVDARFAHFSRGAARRHVNSVLSIPITHHDDTIGTVNLYAHAVNAFDDDDTVAARVAATQAAHAVARSTVAATARDTRDRLRAVYDEATLTARAHGILTALRHCSAEQARHLLTHAATTTNTTLAATAQRMLETARTDPPARAGSTGV